MCGRFVSASSPGDIAAYFGADPPGTGSETLSETQSETLTGETARAQSEPNYNVAPTDYVPVVVERDDHRQVQLMRWGLIPFWAKDASIGSRMINARVETVADKPAFRNAIQKHRCIVPADAFYEWTAVTDPGAKKPRKQPWCIQRTDGDPFAFAGLFASWKDPEGDDRRIRTCTILTDPANEAMRRIHDRMPVMLPPSTWDAWLDPDISDPQPLLDGLEIPPPGLLSIHAVSTAVNNVRSSGPDLMREVEPLTPERLTQKRLADEAAGAVGSAQGDQGTLL